jgi:2,4-dienoyl-CoA reductase (NADPH2)
MNYPHLLSPLEVRGIRLPNRMIMGSMHIGCEADDDAFPRLARFYAERAKGGIGLIVTGGVAPNREGRFGQDGSVLESEAELAGHQRITKAVHAEGGRIIMQLLHCGRYGRHADIVAPSALKAPINPVTPREMTEADIARTIADYGRAARLAIAAGYDGVEVMASEGYLINEFMAPRTNRRTDDWGGGLAGRLRFPIAVVRAVRAGVGDRSILSVRLSMVDLVEDGVAGDEVVAAAQALEAEGADLLNTGIGWHEAKVPTIAQAVPPGAWSWAPARVKAKVGIPVAASTRINTPDVAESLLAEGKADLISMARPLLADPAFAVKVATGRSDDINLCIGCNQGCLDRIFSGRAATCLVNPRAGREAEFDPPPQPRAKTVAVVGGGPAGMACALEAARRGHTVTLFEAANELGGQFVFAHVLPIKQGYIATPRYYARALAEAGVTVLLGHTAKAVDLANFDEVVLATGITPRRLDLPGADHPKVAAYDDILSGRVKAGDRVAIMGCGGIGFDVAAFLVETEEPFYEAWGVDREFRFRGGLTAPAAPSEPARQVVMMQRKAERPGNSLGKTTGWILKAHLQNMGVEMLAGVTYRRIDDSGLHIEINGQERAIEADTIVTCIGQCSCRDLLASVEAMGKPVRLIGGARDASRLDALAAFEEGARLGLSI